MKRRGERMGGRNAYKMMAFAAAWLVCCGCQGVTTVDDTRGRVPATGRVAEPSPGAATLCPSAGWSADEAVLASVEGTTLRIIRADGSTLPVSIDEGALGDETDYHSLQHRGELLAATASHIIIGGSIQPHSAIVVARSDGEVLWRHVFDGVEVKVFGLMPDGTALVHLYDYGTGLFPVGYALLDGEGTLQPLVDFQPRGVADENGRIPGWQLVPETSDKRVGWWDPAGADVIEAQHAGQAPWFVVQDGKLLSALAGGVAPWLMVESPSADGGSESELVVLWDLPHAEEPPALMAHHAAGWLLLRDGAGELWRVSTADGAALPVGDWPGEEAIFTGGCDNGQPQLDARGRVLVPWRDAFAARLRLIDVEASQSYDIGAPLTDILTVEVAEAADTFIVTTVDPNTAFCPTPEWASPAPEGALVGPSVQVQRMAIAGGDGAYHLLPTSVHRPQATKDGLCVLYDGGEQQLVLDVLSGDQQVIEHASRWLR